MTQPRPTFVGLDLGQSSDPTAMVSVERRMVDFDGDLGRPPLAGEPVKVLPADTRVVIAHGHSPGAKAPPEPRLRSEYVTRHVQRFDLGTPYPDIVARTAALFTRQQYAGQWLVVDQTGVGAAVVDMFRRARREAVRCPKCGGNGHGRMEGEKGKEQWRGGEVCLTCVGEGRVKLNAKVAAIHIRGEANERWRYDEVVDTYYVAKRELVSVLLVLMESNPGRLIIDPRLHHARELTAEMGVFRAKRKTVNSRDESLEAWRASDHDDLVLAAAMCLWFAERANKKGWLHL